MSDESLDSFINNNVSDSQGTSQTGISAQIPPHPKLRKIKRPKVRPAAGIQEIPNKVQPPLPGQTTGGNDFAQFSSASQTADLAENQGLQNFSQSVTEKPAFVTAEHAANADNGYTEDVLINAENESDSDVLETDPREELKQSTSIVKAADAQNMIRERDEYGNTFVSDEEFPDYGYEDEDIDDADDVFIDSDNYVKKKVMFMAAGLCLVIGLLIGKVFFASTETTNYGLEGVVTNPDVPDGRPRCGLTDKSQACVFYLMNWYKQELNGRDFYKLAAQLTGREEYMIETDNLRYATVKIKPGNFAQLNIPALQ